MEMTKLEANYKVKERADKEVDKHGTIEKAIRYLKLELNEFDSYWSEYSSDCLSQGTTCTILLISWLERKQIYNL